MATLHFSRRRLSMKKILESRRAKSGIDLGSYENSLLDLSSRDYQVIYLIFFLALTYVTIDTKYIMDWKRNTFYGYGLDTVT